MVAHHDATACFPRPGPHFALLAVRVWSKRQLAPFADGRLPANRLGMQTLFWQWAFRRYGSRVPSRRLELYAIWCGAILTSLFAAAVIVKPVLSNEMRLLVATTTLFIGLGHRRIRLERQKGPKRSILKP